MKERIGLSGIREQAQGFCGRWVELKYTQSHKLRLKFDLGCGKVDDRKGRLITWRHCVCYGELAEKLQNVKQGDLVRVTGWVTTERVSKPDEPLEKKEYLILFSGDILDKNNLDDVKHYQLAFTTGQI